MPIFVSGQKLSAVRYEGLRTSGAMMTEVRSSGVPGGLLIQLVENAKTGKHDLRVLEAFGTSGEVTKSASHPWASHPIGSWVSVKHTSDTARSALAAVTEKSVSLETSKQPQSRGERTASSDPSASLSGW